MASTSAARSSAHEEPTRKRPCRRSPYDITIQCSDGHCVRARRDVLASASDYFKTLFAVPMSGRRSRTVQLKGFPSSTVAPVIKFMHAHTFAQTDVYNLLGLLQAADYLQVTTLVPKYVEVLTANISYENVADIFDLADRIGNIDLRQAAIGFIAKDATPLMNTAEFVANTDANLLRALLDSDDLIVPHEDFVLAFLRRWVREDQKARSSYADELKELIRFPFLRVRSVAGLARSFGPIRGLPKPGSIRWDLETAAFRQRKYTELHCHTLWQHRKSDAQPPRPRHYRIVLACKVHAKAHRVFTRGAFSIMPRLHNVTTSGHTIYAQCEDSLYSFSSQTKKDEMPFQRKGIVPLPAYSSLWTTRPNYDNPLFTVGIVTTDHRRVKKFYTFNTETQEFDPLKICHQLDPGVEWSGRLILDSLKHRLIDPVTGQIMKLKKPFCDDVRPFVIWRSMVRRGDTVFFRYRESHVGLNSLVSLSLSTGQWSQLVSDDIPDREVNSMCLELIQGAVHHLNIICGQRHLSDKVVLQRWDEANRVLQRKYRLQIHDSAFLGVVPLDVGPPCGMDTWLSVKIRKLPSETPDQRAFIDQLRQIAR